MKFLSRIHLLLNQFGVYPKKTFYSLKGIPSFFYNLFVLKKQIKNGYKDFRIKNYYPQLSDKYDSAAGALPHHYFKQDIFIANRIFKNNPERHVDIGSRIDGFVAHVASFRQIEVFDIRKLELNVPGIHFIQADLMGDDFSYTDYCDSVSCLHVIEHFGLGRYGDKTDVYGFKKGLNNIYRILKKDGKFYFSVPIGRQRIEYNAHRVFSVKYLAELFKDKYKTLSFSYIDDEDNFYESVELKEEYVNNNFNCNYGCGIFELKKI